MRYAVLSILAFALAACSEPPEESSDQELLDWVARGEIAAENEDRGDLLDMISPGYADARGNDRDKIGDLLRVYFFRQDSIALLVDVDGITVTADTAALVNVTVGMAGTNANQPGIRAKAYKFEFELQKSEDDWLLIGARWGSIGRDLH
jgi:hypothetical protein